jgi:hypothetical protein
LQNFFRSYRYVLLDLKGHRDVRPLFGVF